MIIKRVFFIGVLFFCMFFLVNSRSTSGGEYWVFIQPPMGWQPGDPVAERVIQTVRDSGARVETVSRYFHAVTVNYDGPSSSLNQIDGVKKVQPVAKMKGIYDSGTQKPVQAQEIQKEQQKHLLNYGACYNQLELLKIPELHDIGLTGKGVIVGVLDAGFDIHQPECIKNLHIASTWNFITQDQDVSGHAHGTAVLGCLGGRDDKNAYYGPAFGATFLLALTEDVDLEDPIDEARWVMGLEWCDRNGARIVQSSVGYNDFDPPRDYLYTLEDMDGKTSLCAQAAEIAFSRGILVVNAAGNTGRYEWRRVCTPADAEHVVTVGAVEIMPDGSVSVCDWFSRGPTADGRIKPDVVALGTGVIFPQARADSNYSREGGGTSLSAPLISGLCALLLEAHPDWMPSDIIQALKATAHDLGDPGPDNDCGWGLPDGLAALNYIPPLKTPDEPVTCFFITGNYPNPFNSMTKIEFILPKTGETILTVYDVTGRRVRELAKGQLTRGIHSVIWDGRDKSGHTVSSGVYMARLIMNGKPAVHRMLLLK